MTASSSDARARPRADLATTPRPEPEGIVYVDGAFMRPSEAKISVFDHGLLYGDGVFEGVRFYNRRMFKLEAHVARMFRSARGIGLVPPVTPEEMACIFLETASRSGLEDGYLRPVLTRGVGDLGLDPRKATVPSLIVICAKLNAYGGKAEVGLRAIIATLRRTPAACLHPNTKSLNYLNNVLAKAEANARGADEAIMLDLEGNVAEATGENVFLVEGSRLVTPPTSTNLEGITRQTIIELAAGRFDVRVEVVSPARLMAADEAFLTGTGGEILPLVNIEGRPIGTGRPGPATQSLQKAYFDTVRSTGTPLPDLELERAP